MSEAVFIQGGNFKCAVEEMEFAILAQMEDCTPPGYDVWGFRIATFVDDVFTRDIVRALLRGMTDKGLTRLFCGLFTEDGEPAGSGYGITQKGRDALAARFHTPKEPTP